MIEIDRTHDVSIKLDVDTLQGIQLTNTDFHRCVLRSLDFSDAQLNGVDFRLAEMDKTNFSGAKFIKSKLILVDAQDAIFENCLFDESLILHSHFVGASFKNADLSKSTIENVTFTKCDLRGTVFPPNGLETCIFNDVIHDDYYVQRNSYGNAGRW